MESIEILDLLHECIDVDFPVGTVVSSYASDNSVCIETADRTQFIITVNKLKKKLIINL